MVVVYDGADGDYIMLIDPSSREQMAFDEPMMSAYLLDTTVYILSYNQGELIELDEQEWFEMQQFRVQ